ncbi:transmembrane protein 198-like isoform X1 [Narcine bancroftii]|uniref:transmembrane protein 198-like isoform X1 n=1 Tax=Narcine bancroftii TaxID=1343680 RepID=UPI003832073D
MNGYTNNRGGEVSADQRQKGWMRPSSPADLTLNGSCPLTSALTGCCYRQRKAMTSTLQTLHFKLLTHGTGQSAIHTCDQDIDRKYDIVPSVVCSMCCLFGVIYCFFGYRCFKAIMFLTGLMFGSIIIFMLCYKERVLDTQLSMEASIGIGLGIGVLCGLVTMLVRSVGLFMVGLLLGLLVAVATLVVLEQFYHPRTVWVPIGLLLGAGMFFAVLTLQWQRFFTVLSTAVFGSAVITVTVDYFIEIFLLVQYVYERIKVSPPQPMCWYSWVILGIWPVLTTLGVLVQLKVTAEGYSHTEELHPEFPRASSRAVSWSQHTGHRGRGLRLRLHGAPHFLCPCCPSLRQQHGPSGGSSLGPNSTRERGGSRSTRQFSEGPALNAKPHPPPPNRELAPVISCASFPTLVSKRRLIFLEDNSVPISSGRWGS